MLNGLESSPLEEPEDPPEEETESVDSDRIEEVARKALEDRKLKKGELNG